MTTIHISESNRAVLERLKKAKRKKNIDDVVTLLISEHDFLEQQKTNQVLELPKEAKEDDSLKCINRIFHDRFYWCVNKPPKMVKLETLEICKVCKQRKIGLTEKTKVETEKPSEVNPNTIYDQNRGFDRYGMIWCPDGGLWVFPKKCDLCKAKTPATWLGCSERKKREEKEAKPT